MVKHFYKRVIAGILSVLTAVTMVPVSVFADETSTEISSAFTDMEAEIQEILEVMQYLETLGSDYSLPSIMISEGDSVYDTEDYLVASTIVPITKDLINDQTKVRTQYWLDSMRVGDAAALKDAETALVSYFNRNITEYNAIKVRVQQKLIALRDYCIANGITKQGLWNDAEQMTEVITQVGEMVTAYGEGNQETATWEYTVAATDETEAERRSGNLVKYEPTLGTLYVAVDDLGILTGADLADAADIRANAMWYSGVTWSDAMMYSAGTTTFMNGLATYKATIETDLYGLADALKTLIGDTTVDSATYINEKLKDMSAEEMMYAYAALYTNLLRVSAVADTNKYRLYALTEACDLNKAEFVSVNDLNRYIADLSDDKEVDVSNIADESTVYSCVITRRFADAAQEIGNALTDTVTPIHDKYEIALSGLSSMLVSEYEFTDLGTDKVTYDEIGDIKALKDTGDSIIENIPANLKDAWYVLFNSVYGIDAVNTHISPNAFASYDIAKADTLQGKWDYNASPYDAVKYVNVEKDINGNKAIVREALRNADGTEKQYAKQSEITPWIDMNAVLDNKKPIDTAYYDLWRNCANAENNNYYNPVHKYRYSVDTGSDMQLLLKDNNYTVGANAGFNLNSIYITVDRYARDAYGSDKSGVLSFVLNIDDSSVNAGLSIKGIYDMIRIAEYDTLTDEEVNKFTEHIKQLGVTDEQTLDVVLDIYKMDHSGFNGHNGYAIMIDFEYSMDNIEYNETVEDLTISADQKVMLLEIPEYSISEYYEDNTSLLKADAVKADFLSDDGRYAAQWQTIKNNTDKLQTGETMHKFGVSNDGAKTWDDLLNMFLKNKNYTTIGSIYTIPEGYSVTLPSYIPVNGRTFDTRYFVKYIPYASSELPSESDPNYYASAHSTDTALDSIASFVNVTSESATGFVGIPIGKDKRNMLTVAYAQDRGARLYHAMQRVFAPVEQFIVNGTSSLNMNNHMTVGGTQAGNNGYVSDSLVVAVAEQGLPQLIWNADSADIYNQVTGNFEFGGDLHFWISKETGLDGLRVADWVNVTPWELRDAVKSTNTLTGNYQNDQNVTSTEKPGRVRASDSINISSEITEGTYATWAFERDLITVDGFAYCETCQKVVMPEKHQTHYDTKYQVVGTWELYAKTTTNAAERHPGQSYQQSKSQSRVASISASIAAAATGGNGGNGGNGGTSAVTNISGMSGVVVDPNIDNAKQFQDVDVNNSETNVGSTLNNLLASGTTATATTDSNGNTVIVAVSPSDAKKLLAQMIANGTVTDPCTITWPGQNTAANPTGSSEVWGATLTGSQLTGSQPGSSGSSSPSNPTPSGPSGPTGGSSNPNPIIPDPIPPDPVPPPPPYVPTWHYSERLQRTNQSYTVCNGPFTTVALWVLGDYGTSNYAFSDKDSNGNTKGIPIDFYFNGIPALRNDITTGTEQSGTCYYSIADAAFTRAYPVGSDASNTLNSYYCPHRVSPVGGVSGTTCPICGQVDVVSTALANHYSTTDAASAYVGTVYAGTTIHNLNASPRVSDPKTWGVVAADIAGAAVKPKVNMDTLYNNAVVNTFNNEGSNVTPAEVMGLTGTQRQTDTGMNMALSNLRANRPDIVCNSLKYETAYVEAIFGGDNTVTAGNGTVTTQPNITNNDCVTNVGGVDVNSQMTDETLASQFYEALPGICTSNLNSMIIPLGSTALPDGTSGVGGGVTPNDPTERYTLLDGGSSEDGTDEYNGNKTDVLLPELKYVPWIVINNIRGVTKDGDDTEFDYTENTKIVKEDILGKELINEYRSETQKTTIPANIVPEVLMSFKEHFLTPSGTLKDYEDRGAIDTLYIAAYNEYAMDLPSFSRTSVYSDINSDSFTVSSSAEATGKAAKTLSSVFPVYYTGCEVNVMVSGETTPEIEFKSWVVDFDNANVGRAWNSAYTATTADDMAQAYVNKYIGASGSFEYSATLSNTFTNSTLYEETSNAPISTRSSTITVDGRTMAPLTVTEDYKFDIVNNAGETNKTEKVGEYPIEIRNGRLASVTADGVKYKLYGDGNITTTAQLAASDGFAVLKAANYELAEAIVHMELPEFAATLVHNGGSQTWQTYKDVSIYTDNAGRTVRNEVKEIKSSYDAGFDGTDGWYAEDVTILTIKAYALRGEIENDYAFSYKVPIDYGYKSPRSKNDLFKSGTALYAYNELYITFLGGEEVDAGDYVQANSGVFDIVGDEGNNVLTEKPGIGYVISNATVDDMYTR